MEIQGQNMFLLLFVSLFFASQGESSFTIKGYHLIGYRLGSGFLTDWFGCIQKCANNTECISYNFNTRDNFCQLNNRGIYHFTFAADRVLTQEEDYVFHQIKTPVTKHQLVPPRFPDCTCNCGSNQCYTKHTPGIGDSADKPASSCHSILTERRGVKNGPYYLVTFPAGPELVYCHMDDLPGCGRGGWTLVMKIDGKKSTFRYNSSHWTSKISFNIEDGKDMSEKETLLSTYWSVQASKICLGMKYHGLTQWLSLNFTGTTNLHSIMQTNHTSTNLKVSQWKSLLPNSSLEEICVKQGFNVHDSHSEASPSARIGILGYSKYDCADKFSRSRLGFGTAGSASGMNDANSCGNEARSPPSGVRSISAFGYIFVQ